MEKKILWSPHPGPQTEVLTRREFEILYGGSRGGGKTDGGIAWLTRWVHIPRYRALVIRRNADDLKDWIDRAREMYAGAGGEVFGQPPEVRFPSGAKIRTGHLRDDNAYTKYQGHEYQKIVIEELTQIPTEENYLKLISSCRSTLDNIKPQVFSTTNPGGVGHGWVKKRWGITGAPREAIRTVDKVTERPRVFIPARVEDNPTLMEKDPAYVKFLDGLPPMLKKAWRDGDWDIFAGQYFAEWNQEKHTCVPFEIPQSWKKYRAYDYGKEKPACCLWFAIDYDGRVWVYREFYKTGLNMDEQSRLIAMMSKEEYDYSIADPSIFSTTGMVDKTGGQTLAETAATNGVVFMPGSNRRIDGWDIVRQYLKWTQFQDPKIIFFNTCFNVIRTIPTLIHDEKKIEDCDSTGEDHAADTLRYFLVSLHDRKTPPPKTETEKKMENFRRKMTGQTGGFNSLYYPE